MFQTKKVNKFHTDIQKDSLLNKQKLLWILFSAISLLSLIFISTFAPEKASAKKIELPLALEISNLDPSERIFSEELWQMQKVAKGDTLSIIFEKHQIGNSVFLDWLARIDKTTKKRITNLHPGEKVYFNFEKDKLQAIKFEFQDLQTLLIKDTGATKLSVEKGNINPSKQLVFAEGKISSSLFDAGQKAGLSRKTIMELASIFGWDIDFANDIRKGDSFSVVFQEEYLKGRKYRDGDILIAEFINQGTTYTAIRYTDSKGHTDYYSPEGRSMRKPFLRSPVDFYRISSGFKPQRYHPILGVRRPHMGVDFAAKTGTPIKASGDGTIIWRGWKGGYGNTVIIKHAGGRITTLYGHMNGYSRYAKKGATVKQGQIIGYVGMTGLATGPHLHYEFRINGVHRNPMTVALPKAQPIAKNEKNNFNTFAENMLISIAGYKEATQLAMNTSLESSTTGTSKTENF